MEILSNTMANTLWNLNNKLCYPEDYYGLIWQGLWDGSGYDEVTNMAFNLYIKEIMNIDGNNPNNYGHNQWILSHYQRYTEYIKPFNQLKFDCL